MKKIIIPLLFIIGSYYQDKIQNVFF